MNTEECKRTWGTAADGATFKDNEDYNARVAMWAVNNVDAVFAEIARLTALLAEAREGLETAAQALHDHVAIEGDQASTAVKVARAIIAKLGA